MRYIDSLNLKDAECFILIEPGEGHMIPVLQEKFPNSKIIALHVNTPDVQNILETELQGIESAKTRIIEWRPSMNFYKEEYLKLLSVVVEFIKRLDAGNRTTAAFGKRWARNFFKNLKYVNQTLLYKETDLPVIITGSGPGLESALPVMGKIRNNCLIIAASSSVMALTHADIKPDLVIATDGGCWALRHLYPMYRAGIGAALAVNLCAALPSQSASTPQLILNDGSLWQNIVLHELQLPSVIVGQKGTVTASAVELALALTSSNIYLAGMDLCVKDIRSHVKPYAFDALFFENADRFSSVYSKVFVRSGLIRDGGSMGIYAAWFKNQFELWPKRIFAIENYNERIVKKEDCFKAVAVENSDFFCERGVNALLKALKDGEYANALRAELEPLLGEDIEKFLAEARRG